ncbi:uncharacterized protein LOC110722034 isoform X3 [Chenopodium quinoa]|uniref:uncharacterized protein LOC110722034 isoform X3 n=1 Tax=Chenopodium quinoa TaxID=63459 RepID=UPI000B76B918|nr:uncharacterized protein LOC110722034 isoform X3 [Chenopodium quinoa]
MKIVGVEESSSDLNCFDDDGVEVESDLKIKVSGCYKQPPLKTLSPEIFKDESLTIGGQVKARGQVLKRRDEARCRMKRGIVIFSGGVGIHSLCTDTMRKLIESGCCGAMALVSHERHKDGPLSSVLEAAILNFDHLCVELGLRSHNRDPRDVMMVLTVCHH